jgi:hypothetical protein
MTCQVAGWRSHPVLVRSGVTRRRPVRPDLRILDECERLDKEGKGALLRREGLYNQLISGGRKQRDGARSHR